MEIMKKEWTWWKTIKQCETNRAQKAIVMRSQWTVPVSVPSRCEHPDALYWLPSSEISGIHWNWNHDTLQKRETWGDMGRHLESWASCCPKDCPSAGDGWFGSFLSILVNNFSAVPVVGRWAWTLSKWWYHPPDCMLKTVESGGKESRRDRLDLKVLRHAMPAFRHQSMWECSIYVLGGPLSSILVCFFGCSGVQRQRRRAQVGGETGRCGPRLGLWCVSVKCRQHGRC